MLRGLLEAGSSKHERVAAAGAQPHAANAQAQPLSTNITAPPPATPHDAHSSPTRNGTRLQNGTSAAGAKLAAPARKRERGVARTNDGGQASAPSEGQGDVSSYSINPAAAGAGGIVVRRTRLSDCQAYMCMLQHSKSIAKNAWCMPGRG